MTAGVGESDVNDAVELVRGSMEDQIITGEGGCTSEREEVGEIVCGLVGRAGGWNRKNGGSGGIVIGSRDKGEDTGPALKRDGKDDCAGADVVTVILGRGGERGRKLEPFHMVTKAVEFRGEKGRCGRNERDGRGGGRRGRQHNGGGRRSGRCRRRE